LSFIFLLGLFSVKSPQLTTLGAFSQVLPTKQALKAQALEVAQQRMVFKKKKLHVHRKVCLSLNQVFPLAFSWTCFQTLFFVALQKDCFFISL